MIVQTEKQFKNAETLVNSCVIHWAAIRFCCFMRLVQFILTLFNNLPIFQ